MQLDEAAGQCQAQAGAFLLVGVVAAHLAELLEHRGLVLGRDANAGVGGDQAFSFIGTAAFSAPAQVRYFIEGGNTILQGNVGGSNGNVVDFEVQLTGIYTLQASDLIP